MKKLIFLCCIILILGNCKKTAEIEQLEVQVENFTSLELNSYFDIELIQGTENRVIIEAHGNILKKIKYSVSNEILSFKNGAKMAWTKPKKNDVKLIITVKNLKLIKANETCDIQTLNTLKGDELGIVFASKLNNGDLNLNYNSVYYWNNFPCGGKLRLSGQCTNLKIWNFALMQIDAFDLISQNALVENSSKGDCVIRANQSLTYKIMGQGNINLYGNPSGIIEKSPSKGGKLLIH